MYRLILALSLISSKALATSAVTQECLAEHMKYQFHRELLVQKSTDGKYPTALLSNRPIVLTEAASKEVSSLFIDSPFKPLTPSNCQQTVVQSNFSNNIQEIICNEDVIEIPKENQAASNSSRVLIKTFESASSSSQNPVEANDAFLLRSESLSQDNKDKLSRDCIESQVSSDCQNKLITHYESSDWEQPDISTLQESSAFVIQKNNSQNSYLHTLNISYSLSNYAQRTDAGLIGLFIPIEFSKLIGDISDKQNLTTLHST